AALRAHETGRPLADVLREQDDPAGELQAFGAAIQMAPAKAIGQDLSPADAVRSLILRIWQRELRRQREALGPEAGKARAQLTYDIKALGNWTDGSAVIELMLER
ncbi:MAG: hypothetical protein JW951_07755, partial [Lentisphaerae bacterium]|nr:hypothetical protein [Lentisphaerota bacterium]